GAHPSAAPDQTVFRFAVRDTGPGVPAHAIERIFAEFEQADSGPARRHGGSGLGLAISKRLVDAMGGKIAVATVPAGGATFTVDLPLESSPQTATIGRDWPRPRPGAKVLLVLDGAMEASPLCDLLAAVGAKLACVGPRDALRVASSAAAAGAPFTALL